MAASYRYDSPRLSKEALAERVKPFGNKLLWFMQQGYVPHYYQLLFHTMQHEGDIARFRHLVAGRRGGKTLCAAWELLYYCLNPAQFHLDAHGEEKDRALWCWVLTKDFPAGRPALITFRQVLQEAGMKHGVQYKENKGNRYFEFENGTLLEFKTADEPESLRGAGLDMLWMDEAAFIPSEEAYDVVLPALADKSGIVFTTTTPAGKNWFHDRFWSPKAFHDPNISRVEYRSVDNTYFKKKEWDYYAKTYHPLLFKQEFMASFDSMQGIELQGEWLKYYMLKDLPKNLKLYLGVDPAISLSEKADHFAMALVGVSEENKVYLLETYMKRIPFPEQVELINEWYITHRPQFIGVEAQAYQRALVQQLERLDSMPPIMPMFAKGKKEQRIMSMSPLFRVGKVLIREDQRDFIDQWINYDTKVKNPKDDLLDAVEIALRSAGALLPATPPRGEDRSLYPAGDMDELRLRDIPGGQFFTDSHGVDEFLGGEW